ncbi:tRNA 2-selenouridine(34) synthase MnmH [Cohnella kolymensis]|uniref:tRNA 2-selenouridine(34) synthase MnmH n=1 Tax=Cohnella kolymensis TaxID=1590652 RepID=UPI000697A5D6|nr:tRNA 2-selenouridine(34) synthase MnmH [Cohnella kolymensis]
MFQDLTMEELAELRNRKDFVLIDVRSPSEFEDSTIPGSLNIPLFDDDERAEIGTLYKQVSVQAAKERGLEIVSAKLPAFIKRFSEIPGNKAVFCWRGGMRSRTTATLLSLMNIHAYRLTGGFRAYRQWVIAHLNEAAAGFKPVSYVLNGYTGSGKTAILRYLKERGHPVLDFEDMAGHRGSIFGHIGRKASNQKTFDSLLIEELIRYRQAPYIFFEAESKRIGNVTLPDPLVEKKQRAHQLWIELPLKERVHNILDDYRPEQFAEECLQSFLKIKPRLHTPIAAEIEKSMREQDYRRAVELLLVHYYDPRYDHTVSEYEPEKRTVIRAESALAAAEKVEKFLAGRGAAECQKKPVKAR